ncbi:hypothetical protein [Nocardia sp. CA-120079]|uniref:hypothetical protein n=1 Tax=Nocardia sp. CA-120079 TaxID=3239974 RepID=UPI003D96191B
MILPTPTACSRFRGGAVARLRLRLGAFVQHHSPGLDQRLPGAAADLAAIDTAIQMYLHRSVCLSLGQGAGITAAIADIRNNCRDKHFHISNRSRNLCSCIS